MLIQKEDLRRCLISKFGFEEVAGSKHEAVLIFVGGRKVATTRFSRSQRNIDDTIMKLIARQIWVQLGYLKQMYNCARFREDYLRHLVQNGHIS